MIDGTRTLDPRTSPNITGRDGEWAYLYASSPASAFIGKCFVRRSPCFVKRHGIDLAFYNGTQEDALGRLSMTYDALRSYIGKRTVAYLYEISEPIAFERRVSLSDIRKDSIAGSHQWIPQSMAERIEAASSWGGSDE